MFVLATTDPHKVLPTIRSRTQHLEFRLINGETLSSLLHDVQGAAGLEADEATIDAAVRLGRGSARDALSALDQLVATGSVARDPARVRRPVRGARRRGRGGALRALADADRRGLGPRAAGRELRRRGPPGLPAPGGPRGRRRGRRRTASAWASGDERLGLARTVRVLETFGRAMREMKSAPEKIVILEVALVRLVKPELDAPLEALDERLTRLERGSRAARARADVHPHRCFDPSARPPRRRRRRPRRQSRPQWRPPVAGRRRGARRQRPDAPRGPRRSTRCASDSVPTRRAHDLARRPVAAEARPGRSPRRAAASPSPCPARRCARTPRLIAAGTPAARWSTSSRRTCTSSGSSTRRWRRRASGPDAGRVATRDPRRRSMTPTTRHRRRRRGRRRVGRRSPDHRDVPRGRGDRVSYPPPLQAVVDELGRFPGVGPKSAQRIAFWLMRQPTEDVARLAAVARRDERRSSPSASGAATSPRPGGSARSAPTSGATRRPSAWSRTRRTSWRSNARGAFHGTYHVLHGVLNPLEGVTPDRLQDPRARRATQRPGAARSSCASTPTSRATPPRCT